jgi:hypothetical protein
MADRPPILPSDTPEQPEKRTPSGREDVTRIEAELPVSCPVPEIPAVSGKENANRLVTENDDGVRNLKASESVVAAFHAEGFPNPPAGIADIIATHVKNSTRDIPSNKLANMTPGSGALGTSAAAGVNMFLNMLTPAQRDAAKAGVNPLDPAAVLKFSAALNQTSRNGAMPIAKGDGGTGAGRVSSDTYARELSGDSIYKALASEGYSSAQVTTALNFAKSIGINDKAYAGYFVGASKTTRDAIAQQIKSGKAMTDDDVTSTDDATAVIGAVKSGKMKREEAPASVQKVMKDMKEEGVDPATAEPKAVHKYFKEHPKALEKAKDEVIKHTAADAGLNSEQKNSKNEQTSEASKKVAAVSSGTVRPKGKTGGLGL